MPIQMCPDLVVDSHAFKVFEEPGMRLEFDHPFRVTIEIIIPIEKVFREGIEIKRVGSSAFLANIFEFPG